MAPPDSKMPKRPRKTCPNPLPKGYATKGAQSGSATSDDLGGNVATGSVTLLNTPATQCERPFYDWIPCAFGDRNLQAKLPS